MNTSNYLINLIDLVYSNLTLLIPSSVTATFPAEFDRLNIQLIHLKILMSLSNS